MKMNLEKNALLFHSSHGLCRLSAILRGAGQEEINYELRPILQHQAKIRYVIPKKMLLESGFHPLMSVKQANSILEYFKTGKKKIDDLDGPWTMAVMIHEESCNRESVKDSKTRQKLGLSVKALSKELAYTLEMGIKEICEVIRKNLMQQSTVNPLVLTALINAESD